MKNSASKNEKIVRQIFDASLFVKGVYSLLEIIIGFVALFISQATVIRFVIFLTRNELSEDPKDFISNYLLSSAKNLSVSTRHFVAFYLLSYGLIKCLLILGLFKKKLWAYPLSIVVFFLFGLYQMVRFTNTHSLWLLGLTLLDVLIIILTWYEYNQLRSASKD